MDQDTEFRELFQSLIKQLRLSPKVAQDLLQRILQALSGVPEKKSCAQSNENIEKRNESEE